MKITNKDTLKQLVEYGLLKTEPVKGNIIISDGSDIIVDDNLEQQRVITENVTAEELLLEIQLEQLRRIKSLSRKATVILLIAILVFAFYVCPVLFMMFT